MLSFEGPDPYSKAGGLGVRVSELGTSLAEEGFPFNLLFVGDPHLPGVERQHNGRLTLYRWCQWISEYHPAGVYQGEEDKLRDYTDSAPPFIVEEIVRPAASCGRLVVVMAEEWQTAAAICHLHDLLVDANLRDQVVLLWNANNMMGFDRIDWTSLSASATVTTVSRFMKQLMWSYGVNPLVIPNGIPRRFLSPVDQRPQEELRSQLEADTMLLKVARWDPDKRWRSTVETVARLKQRGDHPVLVARGGMEAHGSEVLDHARALGLTVRNVHVQERGVDDYVRALADAGPADILNVTSPISHDTLRVLYQCSDAVLANSGREPFGLVGLETMAAGGAAFTGHTGEDYARHLENAVVLETDDPDEAAWYITYLAEHPDDNQRIRQSARETAFRYSWERIVQNLMGKVQLTAAHHDSVPTA